MPKLSLQVAANADDGYFSQTGSTFSNTALYGFTGIQTAVAYGSFFRFIGVSGLYRMKVLDARLTLVYKDDIQGATSALTKLSVELAAAPDAPTTAADAQGRTLTTTKIDWDNPYWVAQSAIASPNFATVIQELVNSYNPTVIQVFHRDDGSAGGESAMVTHSHNSDPTKAAILDITYVYPSGYVWVEGSEFHVIDENGVEQIFAATPNIVCYEDAVVCNNDEVVYS